MSQASRRCWKCLKPGEFPWKTNIVENLHSSTYSVKSLNVLCFNVKENLLNQFQSILDQSLHSVYSLSDSDWTNNVWQHSTALLIISECSHSEDHSDEIKKVGLLKLGATWCSVGINPVFFQNFKTDVYFTLQANDFIVKSNGKVLLLLNNECRHVPNENGIYAILNSMETFSLQTSEWAWKKTNQNLCLMNSRDVPVLVIARVMFMCLLCESVQCQLYN